MILAVPAHVIETAASSVLRARPGQRSEVLWRESEVFRVNLRDQGCPSTVAEAYALSFQRAIEARIEAAGGGVHQ